MDPYEEGNSYGYHGWDKGYQNNWHGNMSYQEMAPTFRDHHESDSYNQSGYDMPYHRSREYFDDSGFASYGSGPRGRGNSSCLLDGRGPNQWRERGTGSDSFGFRAHYEDHGDSIETHDRLQGDKNVRQGFEDHVDATSSFNSGNSNVRQGFEDHAAATKSFNSGNSASAVSNNIRQGFENHATATNSCNSGYFASPISNLVDSSEQATEETEEIKKEEKVENHDVEEDDEDDDSDDDNNQSLTHNRGLMNTLIALAGPEAKNKKPDPLPPPRPMKFEDDVEKFLGTAKHTTVSEATFLENGITPSMIAEANMEIEEKDLMPEDIGREQAKLEFYCKLCQKQTTSLGNFRDHLNGKSHKSMLEAVKAGKKITKGKKKTVKTLSEIGKKSVCLEIVESHTEPILGLSCITEYHSLNGVVCVCNLCAVKFDYNVVVSHVTGSKHRLRYMRDKKPATYVHLKKFGGKKSQLTSFLGELCADVEKEDGRGTPVIRIYETEKKEDTKEPVSLAEDLDVKLKATAAQGETEALEFQDWINEEVKKSKDMYEARKRSPSPSKSIDGGKHVGMDISERHRSLNNLPGRRDRAYGRKDFDPHLSNRSARPYPHSPPRQLVSDHYFDPYRNQRSLIPQRHDAYLDPLQRFIPRSDHYFKLDVRSHHVVEFNPDPVKRLQSQEPPLDPDPVRRLQKLAGQVNSNFLQKAQLSSESSTSKTVLIDYGHSRRDKDSNESSIASSARSRADKWDSDIQQILEHSRRQSPLDSLALLSNAYSSNEDSPDEGFPSPPKIKHTKKLPFSRTYMEMAESQKTNKFRDTTQKPLIVDSKRQQESVFHRPQQSDSRSGPKLETVPKFSEKLAEQFIGSKSSHSPSLSHLRRSKSPDVSKSRYLNFEHTNFVGSKTAHSDSLKRKYASVGTSHSQTVLSNQLRSGSPRQSTSPRRSPNPRYSSVITDHSQRRSRSPRQTKSPRNSFSPARNSKNPHQVNKMKEVQEDLIKIETDDEAERIADLLLQISSTMTGKEDPQTALQTLFSNADLTSALLATRARTTMGKPSSVKLQFDKSHGATSPDKSTRYSRSPEKSSRYSRSPEKSSRYAESPGKPERPTRRYDETPGKPAGHTRRYDESPGKPERPTRRYDETPGKPAGHTRRYDESPEKPAGHTRRYDESPGKPARHTRRYDESHEESVHYARQDKISEKFEKSVYHYKSNSSTNSHTSYESSRAFIRAGRSKPNQSPREKVALSFSSGSHRSAYKNTLPLDFARESDESN